MIITILYLIIVPSVVDVWLVYNRYVVAGENVERVNVERGDRSSAPLGSRTVDLRSRDGQVAQLNQRQLSSIASSKELSRGGKNQQQGQRLKQESKVMPSTSRQASIRTDTNTRRTIANKKADPRLTGITIG